MAICFNLQSNPHEIMECTFGNQTLCDTPTSTYDTIYSYKRNKQKLKNLCTVKYFCDSILIKETAYKHGKLIKSREYENGLLQTVKAYNPRNGYLIYDSFFSESNISCGLYDKFGDIKIRKHHYSWFDLKCNVNFFSPDFQGNQSISSIWIEADSATNWNFDVQYIRYFGLYRIGFHPPPSDGKHQNKDVADVAFFEYNQDHTFRGWVVYNPEYFNGNTKDQIYLELNQALTHLMLYFEIPDM